MRIYCGATRNLLRGEWQIMDRRVKERLVGATIVVAVVVLVVPEMLSGRRPATPTAPSPAALSVEPMRTVTVDVGQNSTSERPPPELPPIGATPSPSPSPSPPPPPAAESADQAASLAAVPPPRRNLETSPPSPISATSRAARQLPEAEPRRGAWAVQVGSFASKSNADKVTRSLKSLGYAVYVMSSGSGRSLRHRVRIGPYIDREAAQRSIAKLKAQGHPASLVPPSQPK